MSWNTSAHEVSLNGLPQEVSSNGTPVAPDIGPNLPRSPVFDGETEVPLMIRPNGVILPLLLTRSTSAMLRPAPPSELLVATVLEASSGT